MESDEEFSHAASDGVEIAPRPLTWGKFKQDVEALGVLDEMAIESIELPLVSAGDFVVSIRSRPDGSTALVIRG